MTIVLGLSVLTLFHTVSTGFKSVEERARLTTEQVREYLFERYYQGSSKGEGLAPESHAILSSLIQSDMALSGLLTTTVRNSETVIDIVIVDGQNRVMASAWSERPGAVLENSPDFVEWKQGNLITRLHEVLNHTSHYVVTTPVDLTGADPGLSVKVFLSSVLLSETLLPQIRWLVGVSLTFLVISVALASLVSNVVSDSLEGISRDIERITRGEVQAEPKFKAEEFQHLRAKLDLLGHEYMGAREDALSMRSNIDRLLQRLEEAVLLFGPDGRLRTAGPHAERILAKSRNELLGKPLHEVFPTWTPLGAAINQAVTRQRPLRDRAVTFARPNLPDAKLTVKVELLEHFEDNRLATLVTLKDAESRRELESQIDTSHRLAAISRITSGLAHEIKNPLNAITLHLELARAGVQANSSADASSEIEIVSREIQRLDRVVKTFLDFNRPLELNLGETDLAEVTREVLALIEPEAKNRSVSVEVGEAVERPIISADRDLLKQAILNVMMNGIEAMKSSGRLTVEIQPAFDDYVLSITDEGEGIPPDIQDRIFNLYFTTKEKGSGVGLAVTFRVVQIHNGTIKFDSEVGKGTCFRLGFPAHQRKTQTASV